MPVTKPRNRLVYFRVSEDEFQQFSEMRDQQGARCISDLVRSAMIRVVKGASKSGDEPVVLQLKQLGDQVDQINVSLQQLAELIHDQIGNRRKVRQKHKASDNGKANAESV